MRLKPLLALLLALSVSTASSAVEQKCAVYLDTAVSKYLSWSDRAALYLTEKLDQLLKKDSTAANASKLTATELVQIGVISREILRRYPPDQYVYLGIGRSPVAFMAYLKALYISDVYNVPLTSMKNHPDYQERNKKIRYEGFRPALSEKDERSLFEHFSHYLPGPEVLKGRTLLLIDYTQTGNSLVSAQAYIDRYFRSKNLRVNLKLLSLSDPRTDIAREEENRGYDEIMIDRGELLYSLEQSKFEYYSEFGPYLIGSREPALRVSRPEYLQLIEILRRALNE